MAVLEPIEVIRGVAFRFRTKTAVPVPVELLAERVTLKVPAATLGSWWRCSMVREIGRAHV